MGEDRLTADESTPNRRLTVPEAAAALGITEGAVRGRVKRKTLRSYREDGAVYVLLSEVTGNPSSSHRDETADSPTDQSELVEELRDRIRYLERQAEEANERDRENRRIIAGLTSRIPQLEAPASPDERESDVTVEEEAETAEPRSYAGGAHSEAEAARRPWWRRVFGG